VTSDQQVLPNYSRNDWEKRTLYVVRRCSPGHRHRHHTVSPQENIPSRYRTIPLIAHYILSLRIQSPFPAADMSKIQAVTLLPSHLDKPGDQPRCKGFALVVLSELTHVNTLLTEWPWNKTEVQVESSMDTEVHREAVKFGFRTLPKRRWEELQEEYLSYRRRLLAAETPVTDVPQVDGFSRTSERKSSVSPSRNDPPPAIMSVRTDHPPSYPTGCLVFVRNVHSETNKTTLRTLFSAAFQAGPADDQLSSDGLDYVDFTKGMDSVRLTHTAPTDLESCSQF
jgi:hypothetical protein